MTQQEADLAMLLESIQNTSLRLAPSPIHGVGVFAIKDIPAGVRPFNGSDIEYVRIPRISLDNAVASLIEAYVEQPSEDCWFVPKNGLLQLSIQSFINHSDSPNVDFQTRTTLRGIESGEELTMNYGKLRTQFT